MSVQTAPLSAPLKDMDEWDDFLTGRYQEGKSKEQFRQYDEKASPGVAEFYRLNHQYQTYDYVTAKEKEYFGLNKGMKSIWEAAEFLNTLVDDSDPDTDLTQIEHLLQTSEAIRKDGHPRWFVLTGFLHDLGKVLCLWVNRNGELLVIPSLWGAPIRFSRNSFPRRSPGSERGLIIGLALLQGIQEKTPTPRIGRLRCNPRLSSYAAFHRVFTAASDPKL